MLPLVSVSIPAYNSEYLEVAIKSALGQSYPNIEIIVSDQCPSDAVKTVVSKFPMVKYVRFAEAIDDVSFRARMNFSRAIELSNGEFINLLCDDDVLHPFFIERLVQPLLDDTYLSMSFCTRQIIDTRNHFGAILKKLQSESDIVLSSTLYYRTLVQRLENFIGETTVGIFRKSNISFRPNGMIDFFGTDLNIHPDIGIWMLCAQKGPLYFVADVLSYWRHHPSQDTQTTKHLCHEKFWRYIVQTAGEQNLVSQKEYMVALKRLILLFTAVLQRTEIIRDHLDWAIAELEKHKASSNS